MADQTAARSRLAIRRLGNRYLLQLCLVAATTIAGVLTTDAFAFRSPANGLWLAGLPIGIAMVANIGWDRRCFMALALPLWALVVAMVVGVHCTRYG